MPVRHDKGFPTITRYPSFRVEKRIKIPQVPHRPIRFPEASIIRKELITPKDPYWYVLHRRGPARQWVGPSQLEQRAIPHDILRGTLPERIIYKYLVERMRFVDGIDFNFQSSLQGGRVDTGGIVADFQFPLLFIILNPLGPTHSEYLRIQKDNEQNAALEEMGYQVYMIPEEDVYDEYVFEALMRKIFDWNGSGSNNEVISSEVDDMNAIYNSIVELRNLI